MAEKLGIEGTFIVVFNTDIVCVNLTGSAVIRRAQIHIGKPCTKRHPVLGIRFSLEFNAWYSTQGVIALVFILGLVLYGFQVSGATRALAGRDLLEDWDDASVEVSKR